jgi:hypothetical protein
MTLCHSERAQRVEESRFREIEGVESWEALYRDERGFSTEFTLSEVEGLGMTTSAPRSE